MKRILAVTLCALLLASAQAQDNLPFEVEELGSFDQPWALAFLPDGRLLLTEKKGSLLLLAQDGRSFGGIRGLPYLDYFGPGVLGHVSFHPLFETT